LRGAGSLMERLSFSAAVKRQPSDVSRGSPLHPSETAEQQQQQRILTMQKSASFESPEKTSASTPSRNLDVSTPRSATWW
jgi:hypothetical protein